MKSPTRKREDPTGFVEYLKSRSLNPVENAWTDTKAFFTMIYNIPTMLQQIYGAFQNNPDEAVGYTAGLILQAWLTKKLGGMFKSECLEGLVNCFPPDTLVGTELGLRPIGQIEAGEKVWGYDFERSVWRLCEVERRHDSNFDGLLVTLDVGVGEVTATEFHPFWVIQGDDLANRVTPRHLEPTEDQGGSLPGRWVNSHDLREGDVVFLRGHGPTIVRRVIQRREQTPVCNLTVQCLHTFAVGQMQVLVHNMSGTEPIITQAGRVAAQDLAANLKGITNPAAKVQRIQKYLEAVKAQRVAAGKTLDYTIGLTRNGDVVFYGPSGGMVSPVGPGGVINRNVIMVTREGKVYQLTLEGVSIEDPKFKHPIVGVDLTKGRALEKSP